MSTFHDLYKKLEDKAEDFLAAVEKELPSSEEGTLTDAMHQAIFLMVYHVSKSTTCSFQETAECMAEQLDNLKDLII